MRSLFRTFFIGLICLLLIASSDAAVNVYGYGSGRSPVVAQGSSVVSVNPRAYQTPDSGLGGLAVSDQTNMGHGDTNVQASSFVGNGTQSQSKTGLWHSFSNVSGSKTRVTLKFDWAQTGLIEVWDGNPSDVHNAITSLSIDYSTNNGTSWTNKVWKSHGIGLFFGLGHVSEPINDSGSESVDLPNGIDITQIWVRDSITSNSLSAGSASANASVTMRIWNIRLEVETLNCPASVSTDRWRGEFYNNTQRTLKRTGRIFMSMMRMAILPNKQMRAVGIPWQLMTV
jgi:hypothetical protein